MVERAPRIGLLSLAVLGASGPGADSVAVAAAASGANGAVDPDGATTGSDERDAGTEAPPSIESPCFRSAGAEAWTCNGDGVTLVRTRAGAIETARCPHGCVSLPDGFDSQCRRLDGAVELAVNGHAVTPRQASWVSYVAWCAVPRLQGTRDDRLGAASTVAWWALKEGVFDTGGRGAVAFSLCGRGRGHGIGPLERCAVGTPWQVGASGIQPSCCRLSEVANAAATLFPGTTEAQLLSGAAIEAGYLPGTPEHAGIGHSAGALRASWLVRVTAIGFFQQAPIVTRECIAASRPWCYGMQWPTSAAFAPDRAGAMRSMRDLRRILDELSP